MGCEIMNWPAAVRSRPMMPPGKRNAEHEDRAYEDRRSTSFLFLSAVVPLRRRYDADGSFEQFIKRQRFLARNRLYRHLDP